ncbi:STAS domain-containing protein [Adhaeribacter aquaticus]|uniref:STAS domain-containing protein n=1 Tax=Adhaeribacter aquaticus TaxID=299567 RepID=UPI00040987DA|nr:STAS domain-containing protein [Adhaeribacter aquaticus]
MELYHEIKEEAYVVILAGTLDGTNAPEIDIALKKAIKSQKKEVIINCQNLKHITSAGIGIFLSNLPVIKEQGMELIFQGMNANIRKVFAMLGLDSLLKISEPTTF